MTAGILIIGNEILSGRTQDTNINTLALQLGHWGIQVHEVRIVPDLEARIIEALDALRQQYRYVFTTGGIGPTHDDITAACVAKAFGVPLIEHPEIARIIRRREAPPEIMANRLLMARVPEGARLIDNPTGGPQGFAIDNVHVMAGIPRVMQAMLSTLEGKLETGPIVRSRSITAYLGESAIAAGLGRVQDEHPELDLGSYPFLREGRYGTTLVVRGTDSAAIDIAADKVRALIIAAGETPLDEDR